MKSTLTKEMPSAEQVTVIRRQAFLAYLFGDDAHIGEQYWYMLINRMLPDCPCEAWHFVTFPDGGGYIVPLPPEGDVFLTIRGLSGTDYTVSADAVGMILTTGILSLRMQLHYLKGNDEMMRFCRARYSQLMAFAETHPECDVTGTILSEYNFCSRYF
ncbi:antirestriction protein [Salmonella enterica]|nr:antirestriction protein [Salmonella enterica]